MSSASPRAPAVLFVCLGNYIRSPICEGLLRQLVQPQVTVDSAAVTRDDIGSHPHQHAQKISKIHGFDISSHISRLIRRDDFDRFDVIVSLEPSVYRSLVSQKPPNSKARVVEFAPGVGIRNPWASPYSEFELMYKEIEAGMTNFIAREIPAPFRK
jgi:protein-tyrosine phosphatase